MSAVEAQALREFADYILKPVHEGLCKYTLQQVALEARGRADRIDEDAA